MSEHLPDGTVIHPSEVLQMLSSFPAEYLQHDMTIVGFRDTHYLVKNTVLEDTFLLAASVVEVVAEQQQRDRELARLREAMAKLHRELEDMHSTLKDRDLSEHQKIYDLGYSWTHAMHIVERATVSESERAE